MTDSEVFDMGGSMTNVFQQAEAMFGEAFRLHGKVVNGSGQLPGHYFLEFTDGSELHVAIEESGNVRPEAPKLRIWIEQSD